MYNYPNIMNYQPSVDKINTQISELERLKQQIQQPVQQLPITQNFQLAPNNTIRYASSLDEVLKISVIADTPFFSQDMSILWLKNASGDVKSYELREIIKKDEKDLKIEFLQAQIEELKKGMRHNAKPNDGYVDEPIENEKSTNVSDGRTSKTKSKQSR